MVAVAEGVVFGGRASTALFRLGIARCALYALLYLSRAGGLRRFDCGGVLYMKGS